MRKKKIKHLGRKRNIKKYIRNNYKRYISIIGVIGSIVIMYNMTKDIENSQKEEIVLDSRKVDFIDSIEKGAKENYKEYGIFPSITIAQAILESGWGQSELTKDAKNLFGIKADNSWNGEYVEVITTENYNDKEIAKFRKYNNLNDSIKDHGSFLIENKRYEDHGVFKAKNYKEQAIALQEAGYSTKKDENGQLIYAQMLINIIESNSLDTLDSIW